MKIFGRKRPGPRREVILGHCYEDDVLDAATAEAREGRLNAAVTALRDCRDDHEVRNLRVTVLSEELIGGAEEITELGVRHRDPELLTLAGHAHLNEAWAVRGTGRANTVGSDRFQVFHSKLRKAVGPLQTAAELLPDDAAPWAVLLTVGMGLGLDRSEQDAIWTETTKRAPYLYAAHWTRLQVLAEKWYGSHDEMRAFAVDTTNSAPPGDPLTSILVASHFELYAVAQGIALDDQKNPDLWRLGERLFKEIWDDIEFASHKWLEHETKHPRTFDAHNLFAGACGLAGDQDRTFVHLWGMQDRLAKRPWSILPMADPVDAYHRMIDAYWPKHLR